jgi:hypothetical protein
MLYGRFYLTSKFILKGSPPLNAPYRHKTDNLIGCQDQFGDASACLRWQPHIPSNVSTEYHANGETDTFNVHASCIARAM